ncbi:alkylated DNA repair protein ALKBH6 homolog [Elaeis guineensis]|uniref:Alpha-ketoglutarate-dependent dioxygenase alkB homolog 6 isoform X2 n=1 Tax=Elaeis guineensis var. tenera TaxID=51953 RepID=A0A6I9SEK3_ELAGV|nr:alpha-ketoglutarate-dependent dioxygenase alkB homolog 6 isoform X2 [Elaeis guineensis]
MEGTEEKRLELDDFIVGTLPSLYYIPNFITESEQAQLLHHIYEVPASRWKHLKNRRLQNWGGVVHEKGLLPQELPSWLTKITQRICQQTGLFPSPINHVLINEYLPDQGIMPHQDGPAYFPIVAIISLESPVMIDFIAHPRLREDSSTCTIAAKAETDGSLGESLCRPEVDHDPCSLLLMPCSLLIFKDQAYTDYLHGIQDSELCSLEKVLNVSEVKKLQAEELPCDPVQAKDSNGTGQSNIFRRTSKRVSLTCRLVLKVHRNLFKF